MDGLANPFADVQPNAYYGKAVIWAANHGVVKGMSQTQFAPNRAVTREQTATFLYRYAVYAGMNTQAAADLSPYTDAGKHQRLGQGGHDLGCGNRVDSGHVQDATGSQRNGPAGPNRYHHHALFNDFFLNRPGLGYFPIW